MRPLSPIIWVGIGFAIMLFPKGRTALFYLGLIIFLYGITDHLGLLS